MRQHALRRATRTTTASLLGWIVAATPVLAQDPEPHPDRHVNRLAEATSPYLRQHRHNPVDWYPWGPEALERAKREDKPIFLSIGYSACHWCHVMERESFESAEIAALMNRHFVNIKVDREERPDLDAIYMAAVTGLTGHGGWPMSVWLTPDLEPFFAGTYFPPEPRQGMPAFPDVLQRMHTLWTERRDLITDRSQQVKEYLRKSLAPRGEPDDPSVDDLATAVEQSRGQYDAEHGGFGNAPGYAPKFPHAAELALLLRRSAALQASEPERAAQVRQVAMHSLDAMAEGGIHDQLGGGFHRYSTDRRWLVPHFEKMLYDNVLLVPVYADAFLASGEERYREVVRSTLDYLLRELRDPAGGFWSATDADSEGEEGRFFVWSLAEVEALLGDDAQLFAARYGVTAAGNWEGANVLHRSVEVGALPLATVAERAELSIAEVETRLAAARRILLEARAQRIAPATDDKVLAAWNGMALTALCSGFRVTGEQRYLDAARGTAAFVLAEMTVDDQPGRLFRSWRAGRASLPGYLDDHAFVAEGLLQLFECDGDPRWLGAARELLTAIVEHFHDSADGSFFYTADDHEELLVRAKEVQESSMPSGIAAAVGALQRGSLLLGDPQLWELAHGALRTHHEMISRFPVACSGLMLSVHRELADPREVVVAGSADLDGFATLLQRSWTAWPQDHVTAPLFEEHRPALEELSPIFVGKDGLDGTAAAWVCRRGSCEAPVQEAADLLRR